jgi:hypothetical protein
MPPPGPRTCAVARRSFLSQTSCQSITALLPKVEVSKTQPWEQPLIFPSSLEEEVEEKEEAVCPPVHGTGVGQVSGLVPDEPVLRVLQLCVVAVSRPGQLIRQPAPVRGLRSQEHPGEGEGGGEGEGDGGAGEEDGGGEGEG